MPARRRQSVAQWRGEIVQSVEKSHLPRGARLLHYLPDGGVRAFGPRHVGDQCQG